MINTKKIFDKTIQEIAEVVKLINEDGEDVDSKIISDMKADGAEATVIYMHWGDEYVSLPPARIKELSHWLIEQGVDHIIGNHPHVVQPIEIRK